MKKSLIITVLFLLSAGAEAQVAFKTIVPQQPVVSGESFQVQYIIEDGKKATPVDPPVFDHFRFVAGPNIYLGSVSTSQGVKPLSNAVYTLEALRPGKFIIPGATITVNGRVLRSNNAVVEVISKEEAIRRYNKENGLTASDYFLRPGEDAHEKIKQNLFVKVMVDKRSCFVGEPVLATFKLYSRLESRSDIVKNPGFYGFTVYDMVNLADKQMITENVNGKTFDVHTIRKVQLYPLRAGEFTVDAMEVKNKVEFSRSAINKKTEQEIVEGVLGNNDKDPQREGTEVFETDITTEPVTIRVKPVPEKNKPITFSGATGKFTISAAVENNSLKKNEEGFFEITISGKGNFIQLSAPPVEWPAGIEGFDPLVKDTFDKTKIPLAGSRTFRYPFVSSTPGHYTVPAVNFAFLDTDSGEYKKLAAPSVDLSVSNEEKQTNVIVINKTGNTGSISTNYLIIASAVLVCLGGGLYWLRKRRRPKEVITEPAITKAMISVEDTLAPVYQRLQEGRMFYVALQQAVWQFFNHHFELAGSDMNKEVLATRLNRAGVKEKHLKQLQDILEECEIGMFTDASPGKNKNELLEEAKQLLGEINPLLDKQL